MKIISIKKHTLDLDKLFYDVVDCLPYHNFVIKTNNSNIISHNCNFGITADVEKLKKKQKLLISQIDARMESRFLRGTYLPTLNIIASSKNSDLSFLEDYIKTKLKNESKTTLIVDEPQWVVDSRKDSNEHFYVAVGNKFLANELLPRNSPKELVEEYRAKGYSMLQVPIGYYETFSDNIDGALTDIAGIATASSLKYISGIRWNEIKVDSYSNPFTKEIITVGNAKDDLTLYSEFFDLSKVPSELKARPMYIHLDMSTSGDKTGIAGIYIVGKRPTVEGEVASKELFYKVAFSVAIKAPKGYEISFDKHRTFIRWLRELGFSIKGISCDSFQSSQILQQLTADGFNVLMISVDRLDTESKICLPYAYLKSTIYERRLQVYKDCDFLTDEVLGLERESDGHINHPEQGTLGCFTGDTKISLVDGRELTLLELVDEYNSGKLNFVYSFNEKTKIIEPKLIENAWCTRKDANIVEVVLDNGESIRCTPNHRFMLRDGSYCEALNLLCGLSLMPLYRRYPTEVVSMKNYRQYYEPIEDKWHYEHRRFATEILDEKYLVHHKDLNCTNNNPTNLVWCSKLLHTKIHQEMSSGAWSQEASLKRSVSLAEWHKLNKDTSIYKERNRKLHVAGLKQHNMTEDDYLQRLLMIENRHKHNEEIKLNAIENLYNILWDNLSNNERDSYAVKYNRYLNPSVLERITSAVIKNHSEGKYINATNALNECNMQSKKLKELCPIVDKDKFFEIFGIEYDSIDKRKVSPWVTKYRKIICKDILNHKVVSVNQLDYTEDVYDLTILDNHNFALGAGVFVHNSKDVIDAITGALYHASQHAEEYAFEWGEDIDMMLDINDDTVFTKDRKLILIDMEDEIKKMFSPKEDSVFMDFGLGQATPMYNAAYLMNGILV